MSTRLVLLLSFLGVICGAAFVIRAGYVTEELPKPPVLNAPYAHAEQHAKDIVKKYEQELVDAIENGWDSATPGLQGYLQCNRSALHGLEQGAAGDGAELTRRPASEMSLRGAVVLSRLMALEARRLEATAGADAALEELLLGLSFCSHVTGGEHADQTRYGYGAVAEAIIRERLMALVATGDCSLKALNDAVSRMEEIARRRPTYGTLLRNEGVEMAKLIFENEDFEGLPSNVELAGTRAEFERIYEEHVLLGDKAWRTADVETLEVELANRRADIQARMEAGDPGDLELQYEVAADALVSISMVAMAKGINGCKALSARSEMARVAFAVHVFEAQHGRQPATLDELVPSLLSELPRDPFDPQRTIGYACEAGSWRVYSVGWDRVDDNGESDALSDTDSGDLVIAR